MCIRDRYTSEPAITVIIKSLSKALSENEFNIILFSCKEIEKWYQKNISNILSNEFVSNHDVHRENIHLIREIINNLETNQDLSLIHIFSS